MPLSPLNALEPVDLPEDTSTSETLTWDGTAQVFTGSVFESRDRDWIRLEVPAGSSVGVGMDGIGFPDPIIRIYDDSGSYLRAADQSYYLGDGNNPALTLSPEADTTYYVSVASYYNNGTGDYELHLFPEVAANNTTTLALSSGGSVSGEIEYSYDRDWVALNVEAGTLYSLIDTVGDVSGFSFRQTNSSVQIVDNGPGIDETFLATQTGTVYVSVGGNWSDRNTTYTLELTEVPIISGSYGPERLLGGAMGDFVSALAGNDRISTGPGDDSVLAGAGDDRVGLGAGDDTLNAGAGNDWARGGDGNDTMIGSTGNDTLLGEAGADQVSGSSGHDVLSGGSGPDWLRGGRDNDWISGDGGDDNLYGEAGHDTVLGGFGNDYLRGEDGDDILFAGPGADQVYGDDGDDVLNGGGGVDYLYGSDGDDTLFGGEARDQMYGGDDDDLMVGGTGGDRMFGNDGNDILLGGTGYDILEGDSGDDILQGGLGMDTLFGENGNDTLTGGAGADVFVFSGSYFSSGPGDDIITDFQNNVDKLDLSAYADEFADDPELLRGITTLNADGDLVLNFGLGQTLTLQGIRFTTLILDDLIF